MEEKENAVAEMFIEDINTLSDHINLVITVHNKQVDEIERLNNIINQIESIVYADISNIDARIAIQEVLDKELKGNNNENNK